MALLVNLWTYTHTHTHTSYTIKYTIIENNHNTNKSITITIFSVTACHSVIICGWENGSPVYIYTTQTSLAESLTKLRHWNASWNDDVPKLYYSFERVIIISGFCGPPEILCRVKYMYNTDSQAYTCMYKMSKITITNTMHMESTNRCVYYTQNGFWIAFQIYAHPTSNIQQHTIQ